MADPVRLIALIDLYRAWRWYGHTRRMHVPQRCNIEQVPSSGTEAAAGAALFRI